MSPPVVRDSPEFVTSSESQRPQILEFKVNNHALTMQLTVLHVSDQRPRDLFPQDGWEDPHGFETDSTIDRSGPAAGSYTEIRVDDRLSNVSFPTASTTLPNRHIVEQMGTVSSTQPMTRTHMCGRGGFRSSWDGQPPFDPERFFGQVRTTSYLTTYDTRTTEHSHTGPHSVVWEQSVAPIDVVVDQNATLFTKLSQSQRYVQ